MQPQASVKRDELKKTIVIENETSDPHLPSNFDQLGPREKKEAIRTATLKRKLSGKRAAEKENTTPPEANDIDSVMLEPVKMKDAPMPEEVQTDRVLNRQSNPNPNPNSNPNPNPNHPDINHNIHPNIHLKPNHK